jgi:hypothetical protein
MTTHVVLIPVDYHSSRKVCEQIQNQKYKSVNEALTEMFEKLGEESTNGVLIYDMNNFMDVVNDQEVDNLTTYFISYITIIL